MKIEKTLIQKALETVKPGLASKEMIEQTTSFCFLKGNVVTYNDEISISCPVEELELEGAVNASELYSFITKVKGDEISLEVQENELLLRCGRSKAGLALQSEVVLPIEEIGKITKWKKLPKGFFKALSFAMAACSNDMSRPIFTCVHINGESIEGTDSYRIAKYTLEEEVPVEPFLLPARICNTIIRMKPIEISEGKSWVHFKTKDKAVLSCRIFEDKFVDINPLLSVKGGVTIKFPKEIIDIIDRAGIFSKRDHVIDENISIHIENKKLQIKSESERGWFTEKARIDYTGDTIEFSVTPYLLSDILNESPIGKLNDGKLIFEGDNWKYLTLLRK